MLYKHPRSKFISWPPEWATRHYNGSAEPCDMLIGFCSCGAAHNEEEVWVQNTLRQYNFTIQDYPNNPAGEVEFQESEKRRERESLTLSYF